MTCNINVRELFAASQPTGLPYAAAISTSFHSLLCGEAIIAAHGKTAYESAWSALGRAKFFGKLKKGDSSFII